MIVLAENVWNPDVHTPILLLSIRQTLQMVTFALGIGGVLGLGMGLALFGTRAGGLFANRGVYGVLNVIINVIRPIPFIIFITAIRPVTIAVMGTSIGTTAAIFPMAIMATVATARIVEQSLIDTDPGVVEAARAMGASRLHVLTRVLIPESLAPLILGYAFLFVGVVDMSAMAGALGGGGLGNFALIYGYNRYNDLVTWVAVIILIVAVQLVQQLANVLARKVQHR